LGIGRSADERLILGRIVSLGGGKPVPTRVPQSSSQIYVGALIRWKVTSTSRASRAIPSHGAIQRVISGRELLI
jgi:hypothetical protein